MVEKVEVIILIALGIMMLCTAAGMALLFVMIKDLGKRD